MNIEDIEVFIGTGHRQDGPLGHCPELVRAGRSLTGPCSTTRHVCALSTRSWPITDTCWW